MTAEPALLSAASRATRAGSAREPLRIVARASTGDSAPRYITPETTTHAAKSRLQRQAIAAAMAPPADMPAMYTREGSIGYLLNVLSTNEAIMRDSPPPLRVS